MYRFAWLLIPAAAAFCAQPRYARLGEFDGKTEVQIHAADPWVPAQRNTPLPQSTRLQTAADSHVEVELDDGSVVRLTPNSLLELSDYTTLSSGQRLTLLSLDQGMAYFTGQAARQDSLMLALPGAQITVQRGTRLRLEASDQYSQIAVIEGRVRFSSPSAEMELSEGEMAKVDPANRAKFYLFRELTSYDSDRWSEARDKLLAAPSSAVHLPGLHYGAQDLDTAGTWVDTEAFGPVWKPKPADSWMPYRDGRWQWYDGLGYTWVSNDSWGWLPYHYGRWSHTTDMGWFWVPGRSTVFKPGEVFWLRDAKVAGWGPLAPAEDWRGAGVPQLFLENRTVWADFEQDARLIDPAVLKTVPKAPLTTARFALALPSPAFLTSRLDATRPPLRTGATRILPMISGVAYEDTTVAQAPPPPIQDPPVASAPPPPPPPVVIPYPPPAPPIEIYYPVPVYTGVVVINPPDRTSTTAKNRPAAPGPPPDSSSSTRTISRRPRAPEPVEPKPPATPRGTDQPKAGRPPVTLTRTEPVRAPSPPPREEPKPPAPRTPIAPPAPPPHDVKQVATPSAPAADKGKN